jgi:hypothetical protein
VEKLTFSKEDCHSFDMEARAPQPGYCLRAISLKIMRRISGQIRPCRGSWPLVVIILHPWKEEEKQRGIRQKPQ